MQKFKQLLTAAALLLLTAQASAAPAVQAYAPFLELKLGMSVKTVSTKLGAVYGPEAVSHACMGGTASPINATACKVIGTNLELEGKPIGAIHKLAFFDDKLVESEVELYPAPLGSAELLFGQTSFLMAKLVKVFGSADEQSETAKMWRVKPGQTLTAAFLDGGFVMSLQDTEAEASEENAHSTR